MKKNRLTSILPIIIFCSFSIPVSAQLSKGSSLVGGNISFNTQKTENSNNTDVEKSTGFALTPSYGKVVKQNLVIGGDLSYGYTNKNTKHAFLGNSDEKNSSYGIGVFMRNYRHLGRSGFYLFLQSRLGADVSTGKNIYYHPNSNPDYKTNAFAIRLNFYPGISYAVTQRFLLETGLNNLFYAGYSSAKQTYADNNTTIKNSGFDAGASVGSNLQWTIGFRFLWGS